MKEHADKIAEAKASSLGALIPRGPGSEPAQVVGVDEIQAPRRAPVKSAGVEKMIADIPALGRAWERMEKNHKDNPYQDLPEGGDDSPIGRALRGVQQWNADGGAAGGGGAPALPLPTLDTSWIYGAEPARFDTAGAEDARMVAPDAAASGDQDAPVFLFFEQSEGRLSIELAWAEQTARGSKMHDRLIVLEEGSDTVLAGLRAFKELARGKRIHVWEIPPFFQAITGYIQPAFHDEFEPLNLWTKFSGVMRWAQRLYSVGESDLERFTLDTMLRRFPTSLEKHRGGKRAFQLLRLHGSMSRDLVNKSMGRDVAPIELDPERA